ncbi:condensin complex protein MksE [Parasediminibacterium sp. JCM 36343]|uniref:condensin complex protein MksE n=1 Tax=Parasediminibacterium sp. JCM 36343 TaxID=3374279 RepID=UPI00397CEC74
MPPQTADIFDILSKGQFICSNSTDSTKRKLYSIIEEEENHEVLYNYFKHINFALEKGDEYFYFSREESKADLERKIKTAEKWIDILDFLKTYDNAFSSGYRVSIAEIIVRLKTDAELETKLYGLKKITDKEKNTEILEKIFDILEKDCFIEIENANSGTYKVLASFKYMEELIMCIHIPQEIINDIAK